MGVGLHQGSSLSPYLFAMIMDVLACGIKDLSPWCKKFERHGESIQDSCKTSNDVRCRDLGSEESTREEVGCGGNEDVKMDEWSHQAGQN